MTTEVHLSTLDDRAALDGLTIRSQLANARAEGIAHCEFHLDDEAYNTKRRRYGVDQDATSRARAAAMLAQKAAQAEAEDFDEESEGEVSVPMEIVVIIEPEKTDTQWLHLKSYPATYRDTGNEEKQERIRGRFQNYLDMCDGDMLLLRKLTGLAFGRQFQPPKGKIWDVRIKKLADGNFDIKFYFKNARAA